VLITLPLGVLQSVHDGVSFDPPLESKKAALENLAMGQVMKVVIEFRSRFWPVKNFGFVHSDDEWFPTWWADERGPVLVGWAGGPRAEWLSCESDSAILDEAFRALSRIFHVDRGHILDLHAASWMHDWMHDRFAGGAYSFTPVGMTVVPRQLAASVADTLFFAGEATDSQGEQGTVQAALTSGMHAANAISQSIRHVTQLAE
jgi:monoamine oxidase